MTNIVTVQIDIDKLLSEEDRADVFYKYLKQDLSSHVKSSWVEREIIETIIKDQENKALRESICSALKAKYGNAEAMAKLVDYHSSINKTVGAIIEERKDILETEVLRYMATTNFQKRIAEMVETRLVNRIDSLIINQREEE